MKKKKQIINIIDFILLAVIIAGWIFASRTYPELRLPKWGDYTSEAPKSVSEKGSPYKHYYYKLSNVQKHAYNMIMDEIYDMPEKIEVPKISSDDLNAVFEALLFDNTDLFFVSRQCEVLSKMNRMYFLANYNMSADEYYEYKVKLDSKCDYIIGQLNTAGSKESIERQVHDYIANHTKYTYVSGDFITSSAYGCLINGLASCEGYAKAACYLFDKLGIESTLISGTARNTKGEEAAHMWNLVNIDGTFKHLDITWDDPVTSTGNSVKVYDYYNITTEKISKSHRDFSIDLAK